MKNFITLRSCLSQIPSSLFEESTEADFLDWMQDGLKLLPDAARYESQYEIFEVIDGKVQLPKEVKQINSVSWQCTDPTKDCLDELTNCCVPECEPSDINPNVCKPMITYKMFLDSVYYKKHYKTLKYVGTSQSIVTKNSDCRFTSCSETFSVTPTKTMYLSLDKGFVCIEYDAPVCDEDGDILIPDEQVLIEFLLAFAIYKHWENRQFSKEEQAANFYQEYKQKQGILLKQARGKILLNATDPANIAGINSMFIKLIKLPEILFYAR